VIRESVYKGLDGCIEISNGMCSVIVSTVFGPRVLSYALDGGENVFGWHPEASVETPLGIWRPYGGHRLWLAPENMPISYSPDNDPVAFVQNDESSITLVQKADPKAVVQKGMTITLGSGSSIVTVDHMLTNIGSEPVEASAWALTIMRPGGVAIVPNEPAANYGADSLLPARKDRRPGATHIVGRLKPGVTFDAARAELETRWSGVIEAATPATLPPMDR